MNKSSNNNNNNNIHKSIPTIEFTINQNNHQNNNNKQFKNFHHFIERSINRTIITNEGVIFCVQSFCLSFLYLNILYILNIFFTLVVAERFSLDH